jgi:protein-arginine kinase activator protein McsA
VPQDARKQVELLNLRQQLETAVQSEDYELAAKIRDKISAIEKRDAVC